MCKSEAELKRQFVIAGTGLESISIIALQRTWKVSAIVGAVVV